MCDKCDLMKPIIVFLFKYNILEIHATNKWTNAQHKIYKISTKAVYRQMQAAQKKIRAELCSQ